MHVLDYFIAIFIILDQVTKTYVRRNMPLGHKIEVIPDFFILRMLKILVLLLVY